MIVIASLIFGVNPLEMIGALESGGPWAAGAAAAGDARLRPAGRAGARASRPATAPPDPAKDFVAAVLGDTEDVWKAVFQAMGARYEPPRLVLFRSATQSACGRASAAVGPFYCSADRELYLDTAFFGDSSCRDASARRAISRRPT